MDEPNASRSLIAQGEGFLTRTRVNTELIFDDDARYEENLETKSQISSFDWKYDYVWHLFENENRCKILDERTYGKVCKWSDE